VSTYYHFVCIKCQQSGGFFSRQAWGWGNFDIIDSFKFLAHHVNECGQDQIRVGCEHDEGDVKDMTDPENREQFLRDTTQYFPCSDDWRFMAGTTSSSEANAAWIKKELAE